MRVARYHPIRFYHESHGGRQHYIEFVDLLDILPESEHGLIGSDQTAEWIEDHEYLRDMCEDQYRGYESGRFGWEAVDPDSGEAVVERRREVEETQRQIDELRGRVVTLSGEAIVSTDVFHASQFIEYLMYEDEGGRRRLNALQDATRRVEIRDPDRDTRHQFVAIRYPYGYRVVVQWGKLVVPEGKSFGEVVWQPIRIPPHGEVIAREYYAHRLLDPIVADVSLRTGAPVDGYLLQIPQTCRCGRIEKQITGWLDIEDKMALAYVSAVECPSCHQVMPALDGEVEE